MKYFIIEATSRSNVVLAEDALEKAKKDHLAHLQKGVDEGWILMFGPKVNTGGGFIIIKANSVENVENFLSIDSLKIIGVHEYRITEFKLLEGQHFIKDWFNV